MDANGARPAAGHANREEGRDSTAECLTLPDMARGKKSPEWLMWATPAVMLAAVCVAGVLGHRTEARLLAHLPGGDLRLRLEETTGHVFMSGPAATVFTGIWAGDDAPVACQS